MDLALCFSHGGEVFRVFRMKEEFGHALIKGISWAPEALRGRKKGSIVLERSGAARKGSLAQELCEEKRRERKAEKLEQVMGIKTSFLKGVGS